MSKSPCNYFHKLIVKPIESGSRVHKYLSQNVLDTPLPSHTVLGWLGYMGTHVPMFVPRFGLFKPGKTQMYDSNYGLFSA